MMFKYKVGFRDEVWEIYEFEGIIFAENYRDAINKLFECYADPNLVRFYVDYLDDSPMFEF